MVGAEHCHDLGREHRRWAAADAEQQPRLRKVVETTAIRAGIPMPRVGVTDDPAPNAFAASLSPKNAVIGVTTGALDLLGAGGEL
ncbi:M48 family metalloprotease [Microcella sp.]|uniref:M48 family metalloprotease n=1 Tax=Microcella sp. TaxID=1913979 RepID=UPI00256E24F1|nr:M48 family metalloprotease [Microcella sp.]MBX9471061.1 M48 family metalloprotease [Microcella sp.]